MKASDNLVVGQWHIVEAYLWDRDYLDLCGPASLVVRANGGGEIAFGAMQASLDIDYGPDEIGFTWAGSDEMDGVSGSGSAELQHCLLDLIAGGARDAPTCRFTTCQSRCSDPPIFEYSLNSVCPEQ